MATEWNNNVDIDDLTAEQAALYKAYKESYRRMMASKATFEGSMQELAAPGHKLVFNYRFGRLSIAQVRGEFNEPKVKTVKPRVSLTEWLDRQGYNGQ